MPAIFFAEMMAVKINKKMGKNRLVYKTIFNRIISIMKIFLIYDLHWNKNKD